MTPNIESLQELIRLLGAASVLTGAMAWRRGGPKEDEIVILAADTVLDALSDSDKVGKIDMHNGKNIRDQITIEQVEALYNEREFRSWDNRS